MVHVNTAIYHGATTSTGPYMRTARNAGGTDATDPDWGFYYAPTNTTGSSYSHMSRSAIWSVSSGTAYQFGCYISGTSTTGWTARTAYCRVTLKCTFN